MSTHAATIIAKKNWSSPATSGGSFIYSLSLHVLVCAVAVLAFRFHTAQPLEKATDIMDLDYQTFDEPPPPVQEERRVRHSPTPDAPVDKVAKPETQEKELQDEKGDVAGTEKAKTNNNIGSESTGQATATPYYRIKPKYPKAALQAGTEGWVLMQIDINESGEVENVRVVDGEQRNMFQSEARRAVSQWKYKPFVDNGGKPTRKSDHQVRVDFKLQDSQTL